MVAPEGSCPLCGCPLTIQQHRKRPLQTLTARQSVVLKDRGCSHPEGCRLASVLYRPVEEGKFALPRCEYGLDVIALVGERHCQENRSFRQIHKELAGKFGVDISERHVPNLFRLYLAIVGCRSLETEAVQARLQEQGEVILSVDAVKFDEVSPALYVVREVLSGEILAAARIKHPDTESLTNFLESLRPLLKVPVKGIVSDKEQALGAAVRAVFPAAPHQLCHTHLFKNLSKPMDADLARLNEGVQDVVRKVRALEKKLEKSEAEAVDPKERDLAGLVFKGVQAIGKSRSGDKFFDPPALKRFQGLTEIAEMVRQAVERKGGEWPFLTALLSVLAALVAWGELARRLELQVEVVRQVARILGAESPGKTVASRLRAYLDELLEEAPRRGRGAARGRFMRHVVAVSERFWPGLFHCYDVPHLPRTNNELEQFFGALKQHQRRTYGRKSTAGGPMESIAPYLLELWPRLMEWHSLQELVEGIAPDALRRAREDLEAMAKPARERRGFVRKPRKKLQQALDAWMED